MTEEPSTQATLGSEVFISYASQDAAVANAIVDALEKHGLRCWIAPRDVRAGAQYADAIVRAISGAKVLVLVLSGNAIASSHVGKEIERASSKKRPIIALRIDAAPLTPALEYFLSESQWIEAQPAKMEAAYAELIDAIREPDRTALIDTAAVAPKASARTAQALHPKSHRNRILLAAGLAVVAVTIAALWAAKFWPAKQVATEQPTTTATTAVSDKSIAVLPFADMSAEKDQEYMSDGMAEEILNLLAQVPDLNVIARTSSFAFKGQNIEIAEIAKKLNVAHVVEGSVRKSGNKLRITAQLVRTADSTHLWSETYDRPLDDIFAVQDEIAGAIVQALQIRLKGGTLSRRSGGTQNLDAYELYLRAVTAINKNTKVSLDAAENYAKQATELDANYGWAWSTLALTVSTQADNGWLPMTEGYKRTR
jgi:TolB-like protein